MLNPAAARIASLNPSRSTRNAGRDGAILGQLRQAIARIEKVSTSLADEAAALPFGIAALDAALGGGLSSGALHEIVADGEPQVAAAAGFALLLAVRAAPARSILVVGEDRAAYESGALYGLGLDEIGLAPERLILVRAARRVDALWAMEEGLRCRTLAAVVGEFRSTEAIDDVAVRRLSLAAGKHRTLGLILHASVRAPLPVSTRFVVAGAPSDYSRQPLRGFRNDGERSATASIAKRRDAIGPPAFRVDLVRNRFGQNGSWVVEWDSAGQRFDLATDRQPLAFASADRPRRAAAA